MSSTKAKSEPEVRLDMRIWRESEQRWYTERQFRFMEFKERIKHGLRRLAAGSRGNS